jgi:transcriptional regulator with XRE-family HTH domain
MENTSARRILAENLRIIRLVRNLSQEALAELAGLDRSYIGGIERANGI